MHAPHALPVGCSLPGRGLCLACTACSVVFLNLFVQGGRHRFPGRVSYREQGPIPSLPWPPRRRCPGNQVAQRSAACSHWRDPPLSLCWWRWGAGGRWRLSLFPAGEGLEGGGRVLVKPSGPVGQEGPRDGEGEVLAFLGSRDELKGSEWVTFPGLACPWRPVGS